MNVKVLSDLLKHSIVTGLIVFFLWGRYRNWRLGVIAVFAGILIDLDHLFDYFYWAGLKFNFKEFFEPTLYVSGINKVFVFFHGWEYLLILFYLGKRLKKKMPGLTWALTIPYALHLFIDQLPFLRSPFAYFFVYRLFNNFTLSAFNGR